MAQEKMGGLSLASSIAIPFLGAILVAFALRLPQRVTAVLLPLPALASFLLLLQHARTIAAGGVVSEPYNWAPLLGLSLNLRLDGLGLLFALLIAGIGVLVMAYAGGYMGSDPQRCRLFSFLYMFMGAMLGMALSDNLIALFIFWEITSVTSFLLIGYKHRYEDSRRSALVALTVTAAGGLVLLAGVIMLGLAAGTYEISAMVANVDAIQAHPTFPAILTCIFIGCFTKSAQFPFHFWLPGAMAAPTPVSAYLHSATMVKAGVFLLARLSPVLAGSAAWTTTLVIVGSLTILVGAGLALLKADLKQLLAYSTVASLGVMVTLLGAGGADGAFAAMAFLWAHALYKGALFMVAGSVDHESGTRDTRLLGGLWLKMPYTGTAAILAGLSFIGLPLFAGFAAKELTLKSLSPVANFGGIAIAAVVFGSAVGGAIALILIGRVFAGKPTDAARQAHEAPWSMRLGPVVLSVAGIFFALNATNLESWLILPAMASISLGDPTKGLQLFYEFDRYLGFSALGWLAAVGLFYAYPSVRERGQRITDRKRPTPGPERALNVALDGLAPFSGAIIRRIQSGYLRRYVMICAATLIALISVGLLLRGPDWQTLDLTYLQSIGSEFSVHELIICTVIIVASIMAVVASGRLTAVAALGIVGFSVAAIYILYGAPDLALTQFLVETLTVVIFVLVFYHLPKYAVVPRKTKKWLEASIAITVGCLMTALVLMTNIEPASKVSTWHSLNSYELGLGRNVVNVILVDFRVMDTLGEIVVLGVAALGVTALLKLRPRFRRRKIEPPADAVVIQQADDEEVRS